MKKRLTTVLAGACMFMAAVMAETSMASIIDFNSHTPAVDGSSHQTDSGFNFDFAANGWGIFVDSFDGGGAPYVKNGTSRLLAQGSSASVTMSAIDGSLFSLTGFDAATMFAYYPNGKMNVTGYYSAGGGVVSQAFDLSNSFEGFSLDSSFTNLASVVFQDLIGGSWTQSSGFSLDNLIVNESSSVPEPATMLLFGTGLAGLALAGIKRRKN